MRLRNTVVSATLRCSNNVHFYLRLGSITVGDRPPTVSSFWKRDLLPDFPFRYQVGIGELIVLMPQGISPTWEGIPFSREHIDILNHHVTKPAMAGEFTCLRGVPTRRKERTPKSHLITRFAHEVTRRPTNAPKTTPYQPKPLAIAMQLDYKGSPFIEAAVRTMEEVRLSIGLPVSCVSLEATRQYTWETDPTSDTAMDIAGAEANRLGLSYANLGITQYNIKVK